MLRLLLVLALCMTACASGKCRQKKTNKDFVQQVSNLPDFKNKKAKSITYSDLKTVQIFIADGSKQCVSDSQIDVEIYKKKLEAAGIKVIKVSHQSDGMMHIQSCGSDTGMIYVFDIQNSQLKKALQLGFKVHKSSI